jgi:hypothetical protein
MKDTVWLHIGTHKTGTTAIQNALDLYDDGTTRYARLMRPNHSLALSALFRDTKGSQVSLRNQGITGAEATSWVASARAQLMADLASPARHLVLSAEAMCKFRADDFARLRDTLAPHTKSFRVLAYVRDPLGFASSMFQQSVKNGKSAFELPDLAYRPKLEPALQVFGRDAVQVVRFDASGLMDGDVIADLCARIGIDRSRLRLQPANERLSAEAIGLIYGFNRQPESKLGTKARFRARYALIDRLAEALPGKLRLDPGLVRSRIDPADLGWLAETWGLDFRPALASADAEPGDIASEADLMTAREAARPVLQKLAARWLISARGRSTDELMARLFKAETTRQMLIGLLRGRR